MIKVTHKTIPDEIEVLINIDHITYVTPHSSRDLMTTYIETERESFKVLESIASIHDKIKQARKDRNNK